MICAYVNSSDQILKFCTFNLFLALKTGCLVKSCKTNTYYSPSLIGYPTVL